MMCDRQIDQIVQYPHDDIPQEANGEYGVQGILDPDVDGGNVVVCAGSEVGPLY